MTIQAPEQPHGLTAQPRRRRLAKAQAVADYLGLPLSTLYDRARADPPQVPGVVRIGRLLRFDLDQVEAWVDQGGDANAASNGNAE